MFEFDRLFADVKIDLAGRAADIPEIGVGHFAGAVHDATMMAIFTPFKCSCVL